jgi:5-methyltetrahydrofolate--homocysteine methyltransferase
MTFRPTRRGYFTLMGNSIEQVVAGLSEAGADLLGSNCGSDIQAMVEIAREFRARVERPVAIRSNAGLPEHQAGKLVYPHTPAIMGEHAGVLADLGVRLIGGCCGVTPAHVRAMRRAVDEARAGGSDPGGLTPPRPLGSANLGSISSWNRSSMSGCGRTWSTAASVSSRP